MKDRKVLLEIADGPEGLTVYTSEEEAVVDWAGEIPALYITVSMNNATAKFGPFTLGANLVAQLMNKLK